MTTSSSYDFEQTRDQIIADALTNVGALGPGRTPQPNQVVHASRALNRVVKSMDPQGLFLWRTVRRTFTTTASTANYSLAADVLSVDDPITYLASGATSRSTIMTITRDDYMGIVDRTTESTPTQMYVEKTLTAVTAYLWPVPDASAATVEYTAQIKSKDFDTAANTPDFPSSWTACLVYGLSMELAASYNQPKLGEYFRGMFESERERQFEMDGEKGRLTLVPFGGYSY